MISGSVMKGLTFCFINHVLSGTIFSIDLVAFIYVDPMVLILFRPSSLIKTWALSLWQTLQLTLSTGTTTNFYVTISTLQLLFCPSTGWKVSKYGVFSGPYFSFFSPNTGIYGPEKTPHLDTFYAVFSTN